MHSANTRVMSEALKTSELDALAARLSIRPAVLRRCGAVLELAFVRDLSGDRIDAVIQQLRKYSQPSRSQRIASSTRSFLRYLVEEGVISDNPLENISFGWSLSSSPEVLAASEIASLLVTCDQADPSQRHPWPARDRAVLLFLVSTGIRKSEIASLLVNDLEEDDESGSRVLHFVQRSFNRAVPVPPDTVLAVLDYLSERELMAGPFGGDDSLFVRSNGKPYDYRGLYRLVDRLFERSGVFPRSGSMVHLLRRTFAANSLEAGLSLAEVQSMLGHEKSVSTKRISSSGQRGPQDRCHPAGT